MAAAMEEYEEGIYEAPVFTKNHTNHVVGPEPSQIGTFTGVHMSIKGRRERTPESVELPQRKDEGAASAAQPKSTPMIWIMLTLTVVCLVGTVIIGVLYGLGRGQQKEQDANEMLKNQLAKHQKRIETQGQAVNETITNLENKIESEAEAAKLPLSSDISEMKTEFQSQMDTAKQQLSNVITEMKTEFESLMETAKKQHSNEISEMKTEFESQMETANKQHSNEISEMKTEFESQGQAVNETITNLENKIESETVRSSCAQSPFSAPRQVTVLFSGMRVLCDTTTDGGNWVVFQRRNSSDVDFYRNYNNYTDGFGEFDSSFWFGLNNVHALCGQNLCELRIDLEYPGTPDNVKETTNGKYFAHYGSFSVGSEASGYELRVADYSGNAGDSLKYHNRMKFTTSDKDQDKDNVDNCADKWHGAWWYNDCNYSNLNGGWGRKSGKGVSWSHLTRWTDSVTFTEMKLRQL